MSQHSADLLDIAHQLVSGQAGRPKQASLRRASSTAYYALFHFLVWKAVEHLPAKPTGLRERAARAFQHSQMKEVCQAFGRRSLPEPVSHLLPAGISAPLLLIAQTLVTLQERRHAADYDLSAHFVRSETLRDIADAERAMSAWRSLRNRDEANVFLAALTFSSKWNK